MKGLKVKTPKQLALSAASLALEKKAFNLMLLDVRSCRSLMDYILICSAESIVQAQSICEYIRETLKIYNVQNLGIEGAPEGKWILMDYNDVIIHIFHEYVRDVYDLEGLWQTAPHVKIPRK